MKMSFARWVAEQRGRDDKYGDVARDVIADPGYAARMTYTQLRAHIERQSPLPIVLTLLDEMHEMWKRRGAGAPEQN